MSGQEETSEESQAAAELEGAPLPRRVGCGLPLFILNTLFSLPPDSAGLSGCALSPFEVLQPFSPLSINKKRKLIAS